MTQPGQEPARETTEDVEADGAEGTADAGVEETPAEADPVAVLEAEKAELTDALQRKQAEFLNYKRRTENEQVTVVANARYRALVPVIEVLDTVDRAREAGEVEGGFAAVAEQLQRAVEASGIHRFGEVGEEFDPNLHEALSNLGPDPDVKVTSIKQVVKAGYRIDERVVRAAQVLVVEPADG